MLMPFLSNLEVSLAGRYDKYSDYGNDFSPKLSVRWQPLDALTLRASWGQGFAAPSLDILTAQPSFSADTVTHPPTCAAFGQGPTCSTQITAFSIANPNLESEQSEQFSLGLAWDATDWLNLTVDYYNIEIENRVAGFSSGTIVRCLEGQPGICPPGLSILPSNVNPPVPANGLGAAFGPQGEILYVQRGFANQGTIETDGVDLNIRTNFEIGDWGSLRSGLQISYVNDFSVDGGADIVDLPGVPQIRANLTNQWIYGDFSLAWNINHIDGTRSTQGVCFASGACADYGYSFRLPSWTTHDLQASWNTPWNGTLSLGVQNLTDKDPPLDPFDPTGRGYDMSLYDGYGRVPYLRYTQRF
jgi:iron complex outermembrane receptor protein